ncbi:hypothetical protein EDB89DRAFT_2074247 [Lactarius sanguifluus]|nr:hypothetical protein EDB89DRAFT_2074247 [Lactarius sanguifluus]
MPTPCSATLLDILSRTSGDRGGRTPSSDDRGLHPEASLACDRPRLVIMEANDIKRGVFSPGFQFFSPQQQCGGHESTKYHTIPEHDTPDPQELNCATHGQDKHDLGCPDRSIKIHADSDRYRIYDVTILALPTVQFHTKHSGREILQIPVPIEAKDVTNKHGITLTEYAMVNHARALHLSIKWYEVLNYTLTQTSHTRFNEGEDDRPKCTFANGPRARIALEKAVQNRLRATAPMRHDGVHGWEDARQPRGCTLNEEMPGDHRRHRRYQTTGTMDDTGNDDKQNDDIGRLSWLQVDVPDPPGGTQGPNPDEMTSELINEAHRYPVRWERFSTAHDSGEEASKVHAPKGITRHRDGQGKDIEIAYIEVAPMIQTPPLLPPSNPHRPHHPRIASPPVTEDKSGQTFFNPRPVVAVPGTKKCKIDRGRDTDNEEMLLSRRIRAQLAPRNVLLPQKYPLVRRSPVNLPPPNPSRDPRCSDHRKIAPPPLPVAENDKTSVRAVEASSATTVLVPLGPVNEAPRQNPPRTPVEDKSPPRSASSRPLLLTNAFERPRDPDEISPANDMPRLNTPVTTNSDLTPIGDDDWPLGTPRHPVPASVTSVSPHTANNNTTAIPQTTHKTTRISIFPPNALECPHDTDELAAAPPQTFQPEYITRLTTDELSDHIKGAAVWAEINNVEGYYIFNPRKKEYHQIHYLEDKRLWAYIDYSPNERSWYTIRPVPLELNVGPLKSHNPKRIDIDSDPDNSPSVSVPTTTFTPSLFVNPPDLSGPQPTPQSMSQTYALASMTLTSRGPAPSGSGGAPSGGPSSGAAAPSGGSAAPGGSLLGGGTSGGSVPGGGGGGAGGGGGEGSGAGGAPIPPARAAPAMIPPAPGGHGHLGGNPPPEFNGDREKSKAFILAFNLYQEMNPTVDQLAIPYPRAMTFLSYIRGPLVDDWVTEQFEWLKGQCNTGVLMTELNLWNIVHNRFIQAYTDTAERTKARKSLQTLSMKGEDIDTYVTTFSNLIHKVGYNPDEATTLEMFQDGLPNQLVINTTRFHHPITWDDWKVAARLQQTEYMVLKDRLGKNKPQRGKKSRHS